MPRLTTTTFAIVALLGSLVVADYAEAQKPRNSIERRLRPGSGFFENSSRSSNSSVSRSNSNFRSTPNYSTPQYNSAPAYATPQNFGRPTQNIASQGFVPNGRVVYGPQRTATVNGAPVYGTPIYSNPQPMVSGTPVYGAPVATGPVYSSQPRIISERVISSTPSTTVNAPVPGQTPSAVGQSQPMNRR